MSLTEPRASSAALALVTTVHLALTAVRSQRSARGWGGALLTGASAAFAAAPWVLPGSWGLSVGIGIHALWFAVCERLARPAPALRAGGQTADAGTQTAGLPRGFVQIPVLAVTDEAPDIRCFRFARPAEFVFVAGQFLTVRVRVDGVDRVRCYSISSPPEEREYLEIGVKAQGVVSRALHATLRPGSLLFAKAPAGAFVYPFGEHRPVVLFAGGIGITPVLSMARHAVVAEPSRPVTLFYSARTEAGLAFQNELAALARRHPQFRVFFAVTSGKAAGLGIFPGRIDETLIRAAVPDVAGAIALICGPQPMIDGMRAALGGLGLPAKNIRSEVFELAVAAGAGRNARVAAHVDSGGRPHRMQCARSGSTVSVPPGQTLLEAAEAAGVDIDSICRAGVCGTCRTRVIDGDVRCESTLLDEADREQGFVLACVTHIEGDCTVEV